MKKDYQKLDQELKNKFKDLYKTKKGKQKDILERDEKRLSKPCSENSPYRDWLAKQGDHNQEHEAIEPVEANPDMLADYNSPWFQDKSNIDQELIDLVLQEMPKLTELQQKVLILCGFEGRTLDNAACILEISKGSIQKILERLRSKFKKLSYEK